MEQFLEQIGTGGMLALSLGILGGILFIALLMYIYQAFALMTLARRTKTKNGWLAWIPFANIYLITQIAKKEWWWTLIIIFGGFIPILGGLIVLAGMVYLFYFIAKIRRLPEWTCVLMAIPLVNLVYLGILAWGK